MIFPSAPCNVLHLPVDKPVRPVRTLGTGWDRCSASARCCVCQTIKCARRLSHGPAPTCFSAYSVASNAPVSDNDAMDVDEQGAADRRHKYREPEVLTSRATTTDEELQINRVPIRTGRRRRRRRQRQVAGWRTARGRGRGRGRGGRGNSRGNGDGGGGAPRAAPAAAVRRRRCSIAPVDGPRSPVVGTLRQAAAPPAQLRCRSSKAPTAYEHHRSAMARSIEYAKRANRPRIICESVDNGLRHARRVCGGVCVL